MSSTNKARTSRATIAVVGAVLLTGVAMALPAVGGAAGSATRVAVTAGKPTEFGFKVSKKTFPHGAVTFTVTNLGTLPHDFKICASAKGTSKPNTCTGKATKLIAPKAKATLAYTFKTKGTYEYLCTVPGHAVAGMKGVFKVT
jgi:uncharacterized cupredoxin-like copper-binding protein